MQHPPMEILMLTALSPLDGRYAEQVADLRPYFSEYALIAYRIRVELLYLKALNDTGLFLALSPGEISRIDGMLNAVSEGDAARVKEIEATTKHDVKAVEYFLQERLQLSSPNLIHFATTSEDINNLAYTLMVKEFSSAIFLPALHTLCEHLLGFCERWAAEPFPAKTHGQYASPSTAGKEMGVFLARLNRQYLRLRATTLPGKLNGATGTFAAFFAAFPGYDWISFSEKFVKSLGLAPSLYTTQIESCDGLAEYLDTIRQCASIVQNLDVDAWLYLSHGYFASEANPSEVGSSTMPHKVNPINFENSEGNLKLGIALLTVLAEKLSISRMQRDLSDSTLKRNLGVAMGHIVLGMRQTCVGLGKLSLNKARIAAELETRVELLAEPIQTILRREGFKDPYELLKVQTRGKAFTSESLSAFVASLDLSDAVKNEICALTPMRYVGCATSLCKRLAVETRELWQLS